MRTVSRGLNNSRVYMSEQKIIMDEDVSADIPAFKKPRLPLAFYQCVTFILGLALTLWCFMFFNGQANGLQGNDYNRISLNIANDVAQYFSNQEAALNNLSSLLRVQLQGDDLELSSGLLDGFAGLENFDEIVWLFSDNQSSFDHKTLYLNREQPAFTLNIDDNILDYIARTANLAPSKVSVLTGITLEPLDLKKSEGDALPWSPFALAVPVNYGSSSGVIIALSSPPPLFNQTWFESNHPIGFVSIRDLSEGRSILSIDRSLADSSGLKHRKYTYEFVVGDRKWEISMKLFRFAHADFLNVVSLFIIVFGCALTALFMIYFRIIFYKNKRVAQVSEALEQKSLQLANEVTERKRIGAALEKSEHDYLSIIDSVTDVIFETDPDARIVFLNDRWRVVTGFEPAASKGSDFFTFLHSDDHERFREDFDAMLQGSAQSVHNFTRVSTSDGRYRAVELSLSVMDGGDNSDVRVVGTLTDVEERRRAERALVETEKKYRAIVENAASGIFQVTPDGKYLSVNPALVSILGYEDTEELMQNVQNANAQVYVSQRERQAFLKELEMHGYMHSYETRVKTKSGDILWINENARAVRDEQMNTLYYEGSISDITARKETDIALREAKVHSDMANRAKSEFLSNMSHELRTPLNSIIGFSEIIKNEAFGKVQPEAYLEYAADIHESGTKLMRVINEILDISKIEAGERQLNESMVDLNALVMGCIDLISTKIQANDVNVTTELNDIPKVIVEQRAIKQVVMNLLSNAVKYTPSGGRITITSDLDHQRRIILSITDTGIGLDEQEIEKALSPFGQLHNDLNRENSGTGLGLTLSKSLTELHGGELELFSQKGIGTTVTVIFPAGRVCAPKENPSDVS